MNAKTTLSPSDIVAVMNDTEARQVVGQAAMRNPRLAHLMALAAHLDERGFEAVLNCAAFHHRYPKEKS